MEAFADIGVFDQNVVSYLELLRLPYTGCNPRGLTLARDKSLAKKLFAYHRVPVPDFTLVPLNRKPSLPKKLKFPLIVKSPTYESSIGISQASVVANEEQLARRVQVHPPVHRHRRHRRAIHRRPRALRRRDGQPAAAGVPGVGDVVREDGREQLAHRHRAGEVERGVSEASTASTRRRRSCRPKSRLQVQHLAKRAYRALDLTGYARIDLRMRDDGKLFVIEANPEPAARASARTSPNPRYTPA